MSKKIAFVFPGQGSQSIGMLKELAEAFSLVKDTFTEASEVLGYDLWQLVQEGPAETLNQTAHTQPALLAASMAVWRVWQKQHGVQPALMAGHSLGEYSALVCAQSLNFSEVVKVVADRGHFMQDAVPEGKGAMAAIVGLDEKKVQEICESAAEKQVLSPANYNAIGQIVIAGEAAAVMRAIDLAKQAGAKMAKQIPVSVPSHCALMKPAADRLATRLQNIVYSTPKISVINNVDVVCATEPNIIKEALIKQLYNPVRWVETIQLIAKQGIELIIECGPGKVLAGLNKRIITDISTLSINDPESLQSALAQA